MREGRSLNLWLALTAVALGCLAALGAPQASAQATPDSAAVAKGAIVYVRYCVSCHGPAARGDGPLAADLRVPVPDMTTLQARSGGRFPEARVQRIIRNGELLRGHGTPDMPAWGDAFKRTEGTDTKTPEEAIRNLTHYLWSLQQAGAR